MGQDEEPSPERLAHQASISELKAEIRDLNDYVDELEAREPEIIYEYIEVEPEAVEQPATEPTLTVEATAYTAWCDTGCIGVTATGVDVNNTQYHEGRRIIATDPGLIPLGSYVTLTFSDGSTMQAIAEDTGGAIQGSRIDILYASKDEARSFGRQSVEVTVH